MESIYKEPMSLYKEDTMTYAGANPGNVAISSFFKDCLITFIDNLNRDKERFMLLKQDYSAIIKVNSFNFKKYITKDDYSFLVFPENYYTKTFGLKEIEFVYIIDEDRYKVKLNVTTEFLRLREVIDSFDLYSKTSRKQDMFMYKKNHSIKYILNKQKIRYMDIIIYVVDYWELDKGKKDIQDKLYVTPNMYFCKNMNRFKNINNIYYTLDITYEQFDNYLKHKVCVKTRYLYIKSNDFLKILLSLDGNSGITKFLNDSELKRAAFVLNSCMDVAPKAKIITSNSNIASYGDSYGDDKIKFFKEILNQLLL